MSELIDMLWVERYRPQSFEELILDDKTKLCSFLDKPKSVPSFIFHSNKPGTGKTSTAKIVVTYLQADALMINSSDERGIDTIRDKIVSFARNLSSNPNSKRCVFLDEADGLTKQAQDSLRNLMEEYSDNCFFIFTANDVNKIIEPIRSRCQAINFEKPNKADIIARLEDVIVQNNIECDLIKLVDYYYPDMRKMIHVLQESSISGKPWAIASDRFEEFLKALKSKNVKYVFDTVYSGDFDFMGYNKWMFDKLFKDYTESSFEKYRVIAQKLADTEKAYNLGVNVEVVFIANMLDIMKVL